MDIVVYVLCLWNLRLYWRKQKRSLFQQNFVCFAKKRSWCQRKLINDTNSECFQSRLQNIIELLKQFNDLLSKLYSDLYNAVITEMEKTWKIKDLIIITNAKETSTVLSIMSKEVRKGNKILKRLKTRRLLLENCVLPWKHSIVINVFFDNVFLKSVYMI